MGHGDAFDFFCGGKAVLPFPLTIKLTIGSSSCFDCGIREASTPRAVLSPLPASPSRCLQPNWMRPPVLPGLPRPEAERKRWHLPSLQRKVLPPSACLNCRLSVCLMRPHARCLNPPCPHLAYPSALWVLDPGHVWSHRSELLPLSSLPVARRNHLHPAMAEAPLRPFLLPTPPFPILPFCLKSSACPPVPGVIRPRLCQRSSCELKSCS